MLVFTEDAIFGELVSRSLEGDKRFSVCVCQRVDDAIAYVLNENCSLTFLDLDIEQPLAAGRSLREASAKMRFIFLSAVGADPALDELNPRAYLAKPFYVRDLLELVDKLAQPPAAVIPHPEPKIQQTTGRTVLPAMPWLDDRNRAAQHLMRLTLETSAQAALINRGDELWAYSGQLPQAAANELARMVARSWDKNGESDLIRFTSLNSTKAEYMLFATGLAAGAVLALIFDAETPISTFRTQTGRWIHSLATVQSAEEQTGVEAAGAVVVSPTPSLNQRLAPAADYQADNVAPAPEEIAEAAAEPAKKTSTGRLRADQKTEELSPEPGSETQPASPPHEGRNIVLEPDSASLFDLTYVCLLIPRFAHHFLTGDLAVRLSDWMQETCIAFNWRLEFIAVRPDYLHWIVNLPPATSPDKMIRIAHQRLSGKIFEEFPRFRRENPSGDFWASSNLVMAGAQPAPAQVIKEFIQKTRRKQGQTIPIR
jgi:REP element-mobilizing transposase RayT/DNA-binding response OmpR family regulator